MFFLVGFSYSQKTEKIQTVKIKTSAECGQCKDRLEEKLNYTKGVKFSELNLTENLLEVKFNSEKISLEQVKNVIVDLGYDADEMKANAKAVENLPSCCKPGGMK
ncbi:MAG: copper chaperone CopZ [Crocinitomicaceae bacterium]|jgi:copper chaperone CopZ